MKKLVLCLFIGLMIVATSCKKDETSNQNNTTTEKPIAVYDNNTGVMTYNFDIDILTDKINEQYSHRDNNPSDQYILESVKLVNKKASNNYTTLEMVLIDTKEETATTIWLIDDFIESKIIDNKTHYYISRKVLSNTYSFCYNIGKTIYIMDVTNGEFSSSEWNGRSMLPPRWFVTCTGHNCNASTCQPFDAGDYYGCTPCSVVDEKHWCEQSNTNGGGLATIAATVIGGLISLIGFIVSIAL